MDPFIPGGVPFEPPPTPVAAQPKPKESEAELQLLSNHVDELGIVTVILWKPSEDMPLGLEVERVNGIGLVLDVKDTSLSSQFWSGTLLSSGMKVLSINGCECSEWLAAEAMILLSSSIGEVTITAAHSQVLYFPTAEMGSYEQALTIYDNGTEEQATNISNTEPQLQQISAERVTAAPAPAAAALSNTDAQTQIPNTMTTRKIKNKPKQPIVVNAVLQKPSKRTPLGLTIIDEPTGENGKTVPAIANIEGLCATSNTLLKVGMRIRSVNGLQCYTKEDTLVKMKRAKATVYIQAVELPNDSYDNEEDNNDHDRLEQPSQEPTEEITTEGNPKTVVARSLSPIRNWLSSKTSKNRSRSPAGGNDRLEPPTTDGEMT